MGLSHPLFKIRIQCFSIFPSVNEEPVHARTGAFVGSGVTEVDKIELYPERAHG